MFYAVLWDNRNEQTGSILIAGDVSDSLRFTTQLSGGYGDASFTLHAPEEKLMILTTTALNAHAVVFDDYYRRVYEGFVNVTSIQSGGLEISCLGYYAKADNITFDVVYDPETDLTVVEVLTDCVSVVPEWKNDATHIRTVGFVTIRSGEFIDSRKKVRDVIESVLPFGQSSTDAKAIYLAIWQYRTPFLIVEPLNGPTVMPDWYVPVRLSSQEGGLSGYGFSLDEVYNQIYAVYDSTSAGVSITTPVDDPVSQARFGVREGLVENGGTPEGLAMSEALRDAALERYKFPKQTLPVEVRGLVRNRQHSWDYVYNIRAGHQVSVTDIDTIGSLAGFLAGVRGSAGRGFVLRTEFDAASMTLRADVGTTDNSLDVLLGRMGVSGGLS